MTSRTLATWYYVKWFNDIVIEQSMEVIFITSDYLKIFTQFNMSIFTGRRGR